MHPILASSNGFTFWRRGGNDWVLGFTGGGLGHDEADDIIYDLQGTKHNPRWVWLNGGALFYPAWSQDGGVTWDYHPDYATKQPPYFDGPWLYGSSGGGGLTFCRDNDGRVWGFNRDRSDSGTPHATNGGFVWAAGSTIPPGETRNLMFTGTVNPTQTEWSDTPFPTDQDRLPRRDFYRTAGSGDFTRSAPDPTATFTIRIKVGDIVVHEVTRPAGSLNYSWSNTFLGDIATAFPANYTIEVTNNSSTTDLVTNTGFVEVYSNGGSFRRIIAHKSKNPKGDEYELAFDWTTVTGSYVSIAGGMYIVDGWIWLTAGEFWGFPASTLIRVDLKGENFRMWQLPLDFGGNPEGSPMTGWYGANKLAVFNYLAGGGNVIFIDVTNPDNPVAFDTGFYFLPGDSEELGRIETQHVQPVTNDVILIFASDALGYDDEHERVPGAVFRSADGGHTWTQVLDWSWKLGFGGYWNEYSNIAINPNDPNQIICGWNPPFVYVSNDMGLTWTEEIVDLAPAQARGGIFGMDVEWSAMAWGDNTPLFPGLARKRADASDVWFRTEF